MRYVITSEMNTGYTPWDITIGEHNDRHLAIVDACWYWDCLTDKERRERHVCVFEIDGDGPDGDLILELKDDGRHITGTDLLQDSAYIIEDNGGGLYLIGWYDNMPIAWKGLEFSAPGAGVYDITNVPSLDAELDQDETYRLIAELVPWIDAPHDPCCVVAEYDGSDLVIHRDICGYASRKYLGIDK